MPTNQEKITAQSYVFNHGSQGAVRDLIGPAELARLLDDSERLAGLVHAAEVTIEHAADRENVGGLHLEELREAVNLFIR